MISVKKLISILLCAVLLGSVAIPVKAADVDGVISEERVEQASAYDGNEVSEAVIDDENDLEKNSENETIEEGDKNTSEIGTAPDENNEEKAYSNDIKDQDNELLDKTDNTVEAGQAVTLRLPQPVQNLNAVSIGQGRIKVNWKVSEGAEGYLVYRMTGDEKKMTYRSMTGSTEFVDTTTVLGTYTFYRVYPYIKDPTGKMLTGSSTKYVYAKASNVPSPVTELRAGLYYSSQVQLKWTPSVNAEGYLIYRKKASESTFTYRYMVSGNSFIDTTAQPGEYNFYRVYPYIKDSSGKMCTGTSNAYVFAKPIYFPAVTSMSVDNNPWDGTLSIAWYMEDYWTEGHDIEGYLVYRRIGNSGTFKYLASVEGSNYYWNSYTDEKASISENNFYKVYPYYKLSNGTKQVGPCNTYAYGKAKIPSAYQLYSYEQINQVRLQWSVSSYVKADGYYVYRKQGNGSFTYIGSTKKLEYIDKSASKTTMNFYRVYPYRKVNGKQIVGSSNSYVYGRAKNYSRGQAIADYGWQFIGTPYVLSLIHI